MAKRKKPKVIEPDEIEFGPVGPEWQPDILEDTKEETVEEPKQPSLAEILEQFSFEIENDKLRGNPEFNSNRAE